MCGLIGANEAMPGLALALERWWHRFRSSDLERPDSTPVSGAAV